MRITGRQQHVDNLNRIRGEQMVRKVGAALYAGGDMIKVDAQISITNGAVSGKLHVPSRPGEPPNNDTSTLANNIEVIQAAPLRVEVSSNADYSIPLELGSSRMAERPFMRPAAAKNRDAVRNLVRRAVSSVVKGS